MTEYCKMKSDSVKILLQESDVAFSIVMESGGVVNTDYADFTADHFLKSFRHILQKPDLSRVQLASILRAAKYNQSKAAKTKPEQNWALVMDNLLVNGANSNIAQS